MQMVALTDGLLFSDHPTPLIVEIVDSDSMFLTIIVEIRSCCYCHNSFPNFRERGRSIVFSFMDHFVHVAKF